MYPFVPSRFYDRKEDIQFLMGSVKSIYDANGSIPSDKRVVHFVGMSQLGKTTLLQMYEHNLKETKYSYPVYISLNQYLDLSVEKFKKRIIETLEFQVSSFLGVPPSNTSMLGLQDLLSKLEETQKNKVLVFLLDEVNTLNENLDLIMAMEEILEPSLNLPNTFFILTGRYLSTRWSNFDLRPKGTNVRKIFPFTEEYTEIQVLNENHTASKLTHEIHEISGGLPGNNKMILDQIGDPPQLNELEAIRVCNHELFGELKNISKNLPNNITEELLPALEALCVLQDFDKEYEMPILLAVHPKLIGTWDVRRSADLLKALTSIRIGPGKLVDWDKDKNALVMEEQIRLNLEKELKLRNKLLWSDLHCAAMKMYAVWAKKYASVLFGEKSEYHQAQLQKEKFDPKIC